MHRYTIRLIMYILRPFFFVAGYAYLRIRYGIQHNAVLKKDFEDKYYLAGEKIVFMPLMIVFIIAMTWAVGWAIVNVVSGM